MKRQEPVKREKKAMQSSENDEAVSQPLHSRAREYVREGAGGNGASMESSENDEAVSQPSHRRLRIVNRTDDSHIPTGTGCCCGIGFVMQVLNQEPNQKLRQFEPAC